MRAALTIGGGIGVGLATGLVTRALADAGAGRGPAIPSHAMGGALAVATLGTALTAAAPADTARTALRRTPPQAILGLALLGAAAAFCAGALTGS